MPTIEITIPERLDVKINRLVDQGEFVDRQEAVREILSSGIKSYQTHNRADETEMDDPHNGIMGHDDEYVF